MVKTTWLKVWACMLMFVFTAGAISLPAGVMAQSGTTKSTAGRKKNFAQRHPMATGIATGLAVHKMAKDSGKNKK
jgi:hypothetical protein